MSSYPDDRVHDTTLLGMWMFLGTVTMLFASFASAYIVRRSGSDWVRIGLPTTLWLNTLMLVGSSAALEVSAWAAGQGTRQALRIALAVSTALGIGFLIGQIRVWRQLAWAGISVDVSPHSSFVYMLTGVHGIHVLGAVLLLVWATRLTWVGQDRLDPLRWGTVMVAARSFVHFLLGLWVVVMALLSF